MGLKNKLSGSKAMINDNVNDNMQPDCYEITPDYYQI